MPSIGDRSRLHPAQQDAPKGDGGMPRTRGCKVADLPQKRVVLLVAQEFVEPCTCPRLFEEVPEHEIALDVGAKAQGAADNPQESRFTKCRLLGRRPLV